MSTNTTQNLNGLMKTVYGKKFHKLVPESNTFTRLIPFTGKEGSLGDSFKEAVQLRQEQGFDYPGSKPGAYAFSDPIAGSVEQAEVNPYVISGHADIADSVIAHANGKGEAAFESAVKNRMESLAKSLRFRCESNFIYGAKEKAVIDTSGVTGNVITISQASFAAGLWAGQENARVDIYSPTGLLKKSGASIVATDLDNNVRTLTLDDVGTAADGDHIYMANSKGNEAMGVNAIITENTSLFGISPATNGLWKGNTVNIGGAITQALIDEATTKALNKGYTGNIILVVNPIVWSKLNAEQVARRRFGAEGKKVSAGYNAIEFYGVNGGTVEVISSNIVKISEGYLLVKDTWRRIGTHDAALGRPGTDEVMFTLTTAAAHRVFAFSNQALFCDRPGYNTVLTGITV